MKLVDLWKDISIAKKLYIVVGIMALLIVGELATLRFAMHTLSAARAFVGGEGLWSKSQKNAAISLQRYGNTRDEADFQAFLTSMQVPEGDHMARLELFKPSPDLAVVREGLLRGHIEPADIDPMIDLLRRFHAVTYLARAIDVWGAADQLLGEFKSSGLAFRVAIASGDGAAATRSLADLKRLNERLTVLEDEFSYDLGVGSRWIEHVVLTLLTLAVLAVESVGLTLTFLTSRSISRGLRDLNLAAVRIGSGDFTTTLEPRSRDELGQLARSVRQMGQLLDRSYAELEVRVKDRTAELARSRDQLGFLDEASQVLASSLAYKQTLGQVAALVVPRLADGCVIELPAAVHGAGEGPWSVAVGRPRLAAGGDPGAQREQVLPLAVHGKVLGTLTLVSAHPAAEAPRLESRTAEELARRIGIAVENALLYELAQRAVRDREDFLSIASHELNTPLTTLRLQVQMAKQKLARAESGQLRWDAVARTLEVSESQIMRLSRLVEELLDVSRLKAGKLAFTFQQADLSEVVRQVADRLDDQLARVGSALTLDVAPGVVGSFDQMRVEQVIDNLLVNAIKYAAGKPVKMSLTSDGDIATLVVQDEGPGIAPEKQATVFERFTRGDSTSSIGGLGLGLFIVREIVAGQGGSIRLDGRCGAGARFVVELPLRPRAQA